ncbi:MAG: Hsp70 family protein [Cyanobacteria bacterium]|nr:Hsp70 family protein [Cyanobacteriota bacterium]
MTLAIDFGTSNTVVARWNPVEQRPETLELKGLALRQGESPALVPSLVYVEDGAIAQVVAGQMVRDRGLDGLTNGRLFSNFKRGIGTAVRGFVPELDGVAVGCDRVGQWFLGALGGAIASDWPELLTAGNDSQLILTVPVDSFEAYRHWLTRAIAETPLGQCDRVRLIDEPTAAALGYGKGNCEKVLVVDFGGGTLDLALVQRPRSATRSAQGNANATQKPLGFLLRWGGQAVTSDAQPQTTAQVLAKAGLNLGGADLDNWLMDHFTETQGTAPDRLVARMVERLKVRLSTETEAQEVYFDSDALDTVELALTRSRFEQILRDRGFFEQLDGAMGSVLQQARRQGIAPDDIEAVLLVGGTSQIPAVRAWLETYFPADKIAGDRPFEAVAWGALQLSQGTDLKDFLYHGYGIRYWNHREKCHGWHPIIDKGQPYPMAEPVELVLGASVENQPSLELVIGELGEAQTAMEIFFEGDRLVTRSSQSGSSAAVQPLNDRDGARSLAPLDPPGSPGSDRVRVRFQVDRDRQLRVTIDDLLTDRTLLDDQALVQLS